jgi:hypothetical protein
MPDLRRHAAAGRQAAGRTPRRDHLDRRPAQARRSAFDRDDGSYRVIPAETPASDLVMSHISVNFDRTGFQQDLNVAFPIDRLRELVAGG